MGGETHDKLPAKVIFRVKVKYTTFSVYQMNKDRGLLPSDSERKFDFNEGLFQLKKCICPTFCPLYDLEIYLIFYIKKSVADMV